MAKDLATAIRAVSKPEPGILHGTKIAENIRLPKVTRKPQVTDDPRTETIRLLEIEVPREVVKFERPLENLGTPILEHWEDINRNKQIALFANPGRRLHSAEGIMSADLFKDMASKGAVRVLKEKPQKIKQNIAFSSINMRSILPHGFKEYVLQNADDQIFGHAKFVTDYLDHLETTKTLPTAAKTIVKAWEPFKETRAALNELVILGRKSPPIEFEKELARDRLIVDSIKKIAEKTLPIAEPRLRGINRSVVYRQLFRPKDK